MSYHFAEPQWAAAGLGDAVSDATGVSTDCYKAEGSTRDHAVACAGEAGGKAAAAACLATPGLQLAAPLCNSVGSFIAGKIAGPIYDGAVALYEDIFGGGDSGISPYQAAALGMSNVQAARSAYDAASAALVHIYARKVYPELVKADPKAPKELTYDDAHTMLDVGGAKHTINAVIERTISVPDYTSQFRCWFQGPYWWRLGQPIGQMTPAGSCNFSVVADPSYTDFWRADIARAAARSLQVLTNQAAVAHAQVAAHAAAVSKGIATGNEVRAFEQEYGVDAAVKRYGANAVQKAKATGPRQEAGGGSGHVVLWLAGAAALGGGTWWWMKSRRRRR